MIVNKISSNYYTSYNKREVTPSFGYRTKLVKPVINNESGNIIFEKMSKYINKIKEMPEGTRFSKPTITTIKENGIDKNYGIMVERKAGIYEVLVQDLSENSKEKLACKFNKVGRMVEGIYDGMRFYRCADKDRSIILKGVRYTPTRYSGDNWGLTSYSKDYLNYEKNKEHNTLGSIFWAMTGHHASVFGE